MNIIRLTYYMMLINFKDFGYWFWTLCYPALMATLFILTTSNIDEGEIDDIPVGIAEDHPYIEVLDGIDFLTVHEMPEDEALTMMNEEELTGFITDDFRLLVTESGFEQTIVESVLNQFTQMAAADIPIEYYDFTQTFSSVDDLNSDPMVVLFYSLIAMTGFYSMFSSIELVSNMQANLSNHGARFTATPINKLKFLISNMFGSLLLGLFSNIVIIGFIMIFHDEALFDNIFLTALLLIAANLSAISIGFVIGLFPKLTTNFKTVVAVVTVIILAFISGLIGPAIKNAIDEQVPIINVINPVAQVSDTMFRMNLLGNYDGFLSTILYLLGIGAVFFIITLLALRRKRYDSI